MRSKTGMVIFYQMILVLELVYRIHFRLEDYAARLDRIILLACLGCSYRHPQKWVILSIVSWICRAILVQWFQLKTLFLLHVFGSGRFIHRIIIRWLQRDCWWCWVPERIVVQILGNLVSSNSTVWVVSIELLFGIPNIFFCSCTSTIFH